ncbi:hypothetical protein J6590_099058, partial [Homalodisca vitripennis]
VFVVELLPVRGLTLRHELGALCHRPEIAVRCFKNPFGALENSVVGRAMSSCCGRDRNLPSASDICQARDPIQVTGMG